MAEKSQNNEDSMKDPTPKKPNGRRLQTGES